jgi:DUF4097 and DUF4098 domain-containing protein YvlB
MRRSALFSALAAIAALPPLMAQQLTCRNGKCERTIYGTMPATARLRVSVHGPVTLEAGVSKTLTYTVKLSVDARSEAEGRRLLTRYAVRVGTQGPWTVMTAPPGEVMTAVTLKAPRLAAAMVSTSDGAVSAVGLDGALEIDTGGGDVSLDRVRGDSKVATGAGNIQVGQVGGSLRCTTGAGKIVVGRAAGELVLKTNGGDIVARDAGGVVHAETGGGGVHIGRAGGAVTAISGGGEIVVEKAGGVVTLRNMAGPVNVGSAQGVRCDSGSGGIRLGGIAGPIRVATSMGSINAILLPNRVADSYLATGNGDITVLIPSNVGVTVQAQNSMADTLRRIVSDYAAIQPRRQGTRVIAQGAVNGGGPLLQISGTGGTIYIKKQ